MKRKALYNVYLYITLFLGLLLTSILLFYVPANIDIDTEVQQAILVGLIIINLLLFAIIAGNISDKINKLN